MITLAFLYGIGIIPSLRYCIRREIEHAKIYRQKNGGYYGEEPWYIFLGICAAIIWPVGLPLVCLIAYTDNSGPVRKFFLGK